MKGGMFRFPAGWLEKNFKVERQYREAKITTIYE